MQLHLNSKSRKPSEARQTLRFKVPGDKTSLVYLLFTIISTGKPCIISNFHFCKDATDILHWFAVNDLAKVTIENATVQILPSENRTTDIRSISKLRSSIALAGGLLSRYGLGSKISFGPPGGCNFSNRPIDRHLELLTAFGVTVTERGGIMEGEMEKKADDIVFSCATKDFGPSVGVTIHALLLSSQRKNITTLVNVSIEPPVLTTIDFLSQVYGDDKFSFDYSERTIRIGNHQKDDVGEVPKITLPTDISYLSTVIILCVTTKKIGIIENLNIPNDSILGFYGDVAHLDRLCEAVLIVREKNLKNNFIIKCECWPGFPTDSGPLFSTLYALKNKASRIEDTVYAQRSSHVELLWKMGISNIECKGNVVSTFHTDAPSFIPTGSIDLPGMDIRACASCVIAGLSLGLELTIDVDQLLRGYEGLIEQLQDNGFNLHIEERAEGYPKKPFRTKYSQYPRVATVRESGSESKMGFIGTCDALNLGKASAHLEGTSVIGLWEHLFNPVVINFELERIQGKESNWEEHIIKINSKSGAAYVDPIRFWERDADKMALVNRMKQLDGQFANSIKQLDNVFIFLGFDEVWENVKSGFIYNRVPYESVSTGEIDIAARYLEEKELGELLLKIQESILNINPKIKIGLAVSPIPNNFSYRVATNEYLSGKYKLAAGVREFCETHDVPYLDVFEQIDRESRHMQRYFDVWQIDGRHLTKESTLRIATQIGLHTGRKLKNGAINQFKINKVDLNGSIIGEA